MSNDLIGKKIERYYLVKKLREGVVVVTYEALDSTLDRRVAIKIIQPGKEQLSAFRARFRREAKAFAKLSHPNIVTIFDYGEFEGCPYLVMDYIKGGTLKDQMKGEPLPWEKSVQIIIQVAKALETAHKEGILHGDIKPANILMANERVPMLSDFGIAKLLEDSGVTETSLTDTNMSTDTPDYMAPEQCVGKADQRSDIYSLGVVLYQLVTGRLPFHADTPLATMIKKSTELLPRPSTYVSGLPIRLEDVLIKAFARNPDERFNSMREFERALEPLVRGGNSLQTVLEPITSDTIYDQSQKKIGRNEKKPFSIFPKAEGGISNHKDFYGNKNFRISLAYPRLLSKRFESLFICHIYLPEYRSRVAKNIKAELQEKEIKEYIGQSTVRIGQKVRIKLFSPEINFSESVTKIIDSPTNKVTFLGTPKDTCEPGYHKVLMSISDADVDDIIETIPITVRVADFAFDHISRPFLSRASAILLGVGSFAMFMLTLLEQIDKTFGLTFGTAAGILATAVYANFYSVYQLIRPSKL